MKRLVPVFVAAVLVLAACQSAAENLTEKIIEESGVGVDDVDFDADTGELKIETDEGTINIGGGEIPEGFAVPFPDGGEVDSVFDSPNDVFVAVTYPQGRYDEIVSFYDDWTSQQGGEWNTGNSSYDQGDGVIVRTANWFGDGVAITVTDCPDASSGSNEPSAVCVTAATGSGS